MKKRMVHVGKMHTLCSRAASMIHRELSKKAFGIAKAMLSRLCVEQAHTDILFLECAFILLNSRCMFQYSRSLHRSEGRHAVRSFLSVTVCVGALERTRCMCGVHCVHTFELMGASSLLLQTIPGTLSTKLSCEEPSVP